jgi:hypothetical protein
VRVALPRTTRPGDISLVVPTARLFLDISIPTVLRALRQRIVEGVEFRLCAFAVEQNDIVDSPKVLRALFGITVCVRTFPHNLIAEADRREDSVHQHLEIVAGGRVAVQKD